MAMIAVSIQRCWRSTGKRKPHVGVNAVNVVSAHRKLQFLLIVLLCLHANFHTVAFEPSKIRQRQSQQRRNVFLASNTAVAISMSSMDADDGKFLEFQKHQQRERRSLPGRQRNLVVAITSAFLTMTCVGMAHAASLASAAGSIANLSYSRTLIAASMLLISLGAMPLALSNFSTLSKSLLKSAGRCALQVSFMGSFLLQHIMGVTNPGWVMAWVFGVGLLAGREATSRVQYTYPNINRNMYGSVLVGGLTVLALTHLTGILSPTPWFDPRTWISIAGMLFGNTLNACALAGASITKQFATNSNIVELRLARGAFTGESIRPLMDESYRTSLTPTINSLAATGVIHIPGMMTGQILAGQSPQQAALYQIMINFLIAATAATTVQLVVNSSVQSLICQREYRLRSGALQAKQMKNNNKRSSLSLLRSLLTKKTDTSSNDSNIQESQKDRDHEANATLGKPSITLSCSKISTNNDAVVNEDLSAPPVLEIKNLFIFRPNVTLDLILRDGDRIGISGKSGIGKSQILRTIVGLERISFKKNVAEDERGVIKLMNGRVGLDDLPNYRRSVCLVPQTMHSIEGTPQEFFNQVLEFKTQQQFPKNQQMLEELLNSWDVETSALNQPWSTLSGGQSQRLQLAIALALKPKILLMDESLSALDSKTSQLVERTLIESRIPIIIVTHSDEQKQRFCTHEIKLS